MGLENFDMDDRRRGKNVMKTYPKIQTRYTRDPHTHRIIPGVVSKLAFSSIHEWQFSEKIDGMNVRIEYDARDFCYGSLISFAGRTEKAQLPEKLFFYLKETFKYSLLDDVFPEDTRVTLFGEGYGGGIQKGGGLYREDNAFILFDAYIDGWWLSHETLKHLADELGIECVPLVPGTSFEEAISYIISEPQSMITRKKKTAEGIVARSEPLMLFRNGNPVMWKLKVKDYIELGVIPE